MDRESQNLSEEMPKAHFKGFKLKFTSYISKRLSLGHLYIDLLLETSRQYRRHKLQGTHGAYHEEYRSVVVSRWHIYFLGQAV